MMQNYAKFDSRIAQESQSLGYDSYAGSYTSDGYGILDRLIDGFQDILQAIFLLCIAAGVVMVGFYFLFLLLTLIKYGPEKTLEYLQKHASLAWKSCMIFWKKIEQFFRFLWQKKLINFGVVFGIFCLHIGNTIVSGDSSILRLTKIEHGYVGVDLKNSRIIAPGYHLYSPIRSSYFLSPTNVFDFEIAEVTANTTEELEVTLDYRVGFVLLDDHRLDLYTTYGAKNIQLISSDIVMPRLLEIIKSTIRNYSFKDISSKHNEIKSITLAEANTVLKNIGIEVRDINILDIRLPKSYLASKEDLLKAENELKLAEAELETQRKSSEKLEIAAQSNKKIRIIEAEAIAEYNKIVNSQNITDQSLELKRIENETKKIEKWDGKLPTNLSGTIDF